MYLWYSMNCITFCMSRQNGTGSQLVGEMGVGKMGVGEMGLTRGCYGVGGFNTHFVDYKL